ncbi:MAG: hypothetical protein Q4E33_03225 [Erysipelotrichaceae bacterium]|nr:hypothetical protein [Erysipelotrichaceae bacterium]
MTKELKDQELNEINGGVAKIDSEKASGYRRIRDVLVEDFAEADVRRAAVAGEEMNSESFAKAGVADVQKNQRFSRIRPAISLAYRIFGIEEK